MKCLHFQTVEFNRKVKQLQILSPSLQLWVFDVHNYNFLEFISLLNWNYQTYYFGFLAANELLEVLELSFSKLLFYTLAFKFKSPNLNSKM